MLFKFFLDQVVSPLEVVDPSLLAQILHVELQHANNKGIWGVMHLLMLAKATLRQPPYNKKKQWFDSSTFVLLISKNGGMRESPQFGKKYSKVTLNLHQ